MKKLISLALAFIMCILPLLLFSCSNKPEPNPLTDFEYGYREEYGGMSITKYIGTSKSIVFPEEIDGQPVKIIGGYLLDEGEMRPLIESVVIPDTVEVIALSTFSGCKNLSKVIFEVELFECYAKGFLEECGEMLTEMEKEMLPTGAMMMTFECGMRFLTDYLEGDVYFKIHREKHNLDRCRDQFALVADMERKLPEMQAIVRRLNRA